MLRPRDISIHLVTNLQLLLNSKTEHVKLDLPALTHSHADIASVLIKERHRFLRQTTGQDLFF